MQSIPSISNSIFRSEIFIKKNIFSIAQMHTRDFYIMLFRLNYPEGTTDTAVIALLHFCFNKDLFRFLEKNTFIVNGIYISFFLM